MHTNKIKTENRVLCIHSYIFIKKNVSFSFSKKKKKIVLYLHSLQKKKKSKINNEKWSFMHVVSFNQD